MSLVVRDGVDPDDFSSWAVIEECYEVFEDVVEGVTLRVLYPTCYNDDATLANLPFLAREALAKSVSTYSSLGEIGDMNVVFSLVDTPESGRKGTFAVATVDSQWGSATIAGACPITVFPRAARGDGAVQQTIAHEAWHCVQHYSGCPQGVETGRRRPAEFDRRLADLVRKTAADTQFGFGIETYS